MKNFVTTAIALMLGSTALAADQVPWSEDFAAYNSISKWPSAKGISSTRSITQSSGQLYMAQAPTNKENGYYLWFTENGFDLEAGKSYRFDIDSRTNSDAGSKYFEIRLCKKGEAKPTVNDEYSVIMKVEGITQDMLTYSDYFEPAETGEYYLCLYAYANYAARAMYWDNFNLVEASMDAPAKPGISVTADASGVLKTSVEVTCPLKSIRGNDLTALTKLVIYRDGGIVREVETPAVNSTVTVTDYVAQPGNHVYSAVAYNEYGAGAQADYTLVVGTGVEKYTYLYEAIYTPEGKVRIQWPAKAGVTSYKVASTDGRELQGTPVLDEATSTYWVIDDAFSAGDEPKGWQWVVSQVDDGGTASALGTTNYLCLNNEIPYYPTMTTATALDAFTLDQTYQYGWQYYGGGGGSIGASISRDYSTKEMRRLWLISPGLKLAHDKFYRVLVTGSSDSGTVTYTIKAGQSNEHEALTIPVTENRPTVAGGSNMDVTQTDEMFLSVPEDGMYFVGIIGEIPANVNSDALRLKRFDIIEVDGTLPDVPTDVRVAYSAVGGNDAKISFKVPEKAINGTDVAGLTKVEIYKDGTLYRTITDGVTPGAAMEFDVEVTPGVQNVYAIRAWNAAGQGESATAKVFVLSTPYTNDFNSADKLEGFTVINNLGTTNTIEIFNERIRIFPNDLGNDHWLITPPITLQKGMYYDLTFNAKSLVDDCGNLDVFIGKGASPDLLTDRVMETIPLDMAANIFMGNREEYFTVEEDGQYFLGFHFTRPAERNIKAEVYMDDLSISAAINGIQPDRGILEVIPAADGSLKAELSYTAATKSLNGSDLNPNSTQDVYFYINGEQTPANRTYKAYPGQKVAITVEVPEDLPYIFSARTGWAGRISYKDAFVGINRPDYPDPDKIVLKETQPYGHVLMTWEAPTTDYEGYALNPELLTYEVMSLQPSPQNPENLIEVPVLENIKGTSCEFDAVAPEAAQTMVRYVLRARNPRGEGSRGVLTSYINVGKPYRMPYRESFASDPGQPGIRTAIFDESLEGLCRWGLMTDGVDGIKSADNDGVYLALEALLVDSRGRFYTGKVNLGSGQAPCLTLMVHNPGTSNRKAENLLEFKVFTYSDGKWHSLGAPRTVDDLCNGLPGWNKVSVDLGEYADNVVVCGVEATCKTHTFTSIDDIRIWEIPVHDLSLQSLTAPVSVTPGEEFAVEVVVANNGRETAVPESVDMLIDGETVAAADGVEIEAGKMHVFRLTHSFPTVDPATSHELNFAVNYNADEDPVDNERGPVTVMTVDNALLPVTNIAATTDSENIVTLTWDAPQEVQAGVTTETFENWEPGVASQHGWTSFDADGRNILGINNGAGSAVVLPGLPSNQPASFAVVDNATSELSPEYFPAKSGSRFLMSLCPGGQVGMADDWMISPELSGKAQTVKFNVRNYATYGARFQVLYSDGAMYIGGFTTSGETGSVSNAQWQEESFELPEGTRRMAIRNVSPADGGFMFMIDDITFEGAGCSASDLKGYNVYREAECLAQPESASHTFSEPFAPGNYVFGVTARYSKGESRLVPVEIEVRESGIDTTVAEGIHVFGGHGCIHVTGAEGLTVEVHDLRGILLSSSVMGAESRIAAASGIYIVTVSGKSYKVAVK